MLIDLREEYCLLYWAFDAKPLRIDTDPDALHDPLSTLHDISPVLGNILTSNRWKAEYRNIEIGVPPQTTEEEMEHIGELIRDIYVTAGLVYNNIKVAPRGIWIYQGIRQLKNIEENTRNALGSGDTAFIDTDEYFTSLYLFPGGDIKNSSIYTIANRLVPISGELTEQGKILEEKWGWQPVPPALCLYRAVPGPYKSFLDTCESIVYYALDKEAVEVITSLTEEEKSLWPNVTAEPL